MIDNTKLGNGCQCSCSIHSWQCGILTSCVLYKIVLNGIIFVLINRAQNPRVPEARGQWGWSPPPSAKESAPPGFHHAKKDKIKRHREHVSLNLRRRMKKENDKSPYGSKI